MYSTATLGWLWLCFNYFAGASEIVFLSWQSKPAERSSHFWGVLRELSNHSGASTKLEYQPVFSLLCGKYNEYRQIQKRITLSKSPSRKDFCIIRFLSETAFIGAVRCKNDSAAALLNYAEITFHFWDFDEVAFFESGGIQDSLFGGGFDIIFPFLRHSLSREHEAICHQRTLQGSGAGGTAQSCLWSTIIWVLSEEQCSG